MRISPIITTFALLLPIYAHAGVVEVDEFDLWQGSVGEFTTITFTEFFPGMPITEEYALLGVNFTDGNEYILPADIFGDGAGLTSQFKVHQDATITIAFDAPQQWIAIDFIALAQMDLYLEGQLVYTSSLFHAGPGGPDNVFAGLISSAAFDEVVVYRTPGSGAAVIDNLHFGVPAPGALPLLGLAALLGRSRRRRRL